MSASGPELAAGLYVVATPIGNPEDLSPRARQCLEQVDLIAAEDTRITRSLLRYLGLRNELLSYHDHNERGRVPQILERLRGGARVALVSDAGTPLLSDPGYPLVCAAVAEGIPVVPIPGPSAALAAVSVSGLPTDRLLVLGFLPRRGGRRRQAIEALRTEPATVVLFEAPHRIVETLRDLAELLGPRRAVLGQSLTKDDEQILRGTLPELTETLEDRDKVYGELTLVIEGGGEPEPGELIDRLIARLLEAGLSARAVRDVVADVFDLPRSDIYARVNALRRS